MSQTTITRGDLIVTKTEINTLFKEYPEEMEDLSLHELKLLMSWRMKIGISV